MEILGYEFRDDALIEEALTTPSCRMETPQARDNQRLEFLGDAVLGLLSAERVFTEFPDAPEGSLTMKRAHMVSTAALGAAARRLGLLERLRRNRGAGELPSGSKTLADAVEAVIGAAWLEGGMSAARQVFETLGLTANARLDDFSGNTKGELQMLAQRMTPPTVPEYETVGVQGPAHAPVFTVRVRVAGLGEATAEASSRKEAEMRAAARLLAECPGREGHG